MYPQPVVPVSYPGVPDPSDSSPAGSPSTKSIPLVSALSTDPTDLHADEAADARDTGNDAAQHRASVPAQQTEHAQHGAELRPSGKTQSPGCSSQGLYGAQIPRFSPQKGSGTEGDSRGGSHGSRRIQPARSRLSRSTPDPCTCASGGSLCGCQQDRWQDPSPLVHDGAGIVGEETVSSAGGVWSQRGGVSDGGSVMEVPAVSPSGVGSPPEISAPLSPLSPFANVGISFAEAPGNNPFQSDRGFALYGTRADRSPCQGSDQSPIQGSSELGRRRSALKRGLSGALAARSQREASKQYCIRRAPPLLTLHLKRFEQVSNFPQF